MSESRPVFSFVADSPNYENLFKIKVFSAEDRYKILDARDKILRARISKNKLGVELIGTCNDMCPEKERYKRAYLERLPLYEVSLKQGQAEYHKFAIKEYTKSPVDQENPLPHDIRPEKTLMMTMDYILHNIVCLDECCLGDWFHFVLDRTRAIRKDMKQQNLCTPGAVSLMEKCTRFHIHCSYRLCELHVPFFDGKLNEDLLKKCLYYLENLYSVLKMNNIECANEHEFKAYQILMNLDDSKIVCGMQQKPALLKSLLVDQAIKIHTAFCGKDFQYFFKIVTELPYLAACVVHRYFCKVRTEAFKTIIESHSPRKNHQESWVCASSIQRMLGYGPKEKNKFSSICTAHGCLFDEESEKIILPSSFRTPQLTSICREIFLIESKLMTTVAEAINGGPLSPNPYPFHIPKNSFDEQGYLIPEPIISPLTTSSVIFPCESDIQVRKESKCKPSDEELAKHINAKRLVQIGLKTTRELFNRIQQRRVVKIWKKFTEKRKYEKKVAEERDRHYKNTKGSPAGNQFEKSVVESFASDTDSSAPTSSAPDITIGEPSSVEPFQDYSDKNTSTHTYENIIPEDMPLFPSETQSRQVLQSGSLTIKTKAEKKVMPEDYLVVIKCNICNKEFKKRGQLNRHKKIHTGEKPFECTTCGKSFLQKSQLTVHEKIHAGEKPYSCASCEKNFTRNSDLKEHSLIHSGKKPFQCEKCKKEFTQKGSLIVHQRIHTNEKPFECDICEKKFRSSSQLCRHKRTHIN